MKTRNSIWISIYFLSVSWLFMSPVFTSTSVLWLAAVFCGVITGIYSVKSLEIGKLDWKYALAVIPLIVTAVLAGFPYNTGLVILALGIVLCSAHKKTVFVGIGLIIPGSILSFQALFMPLYFKLASRFHDFGAAGWVLKWILGIFGIRSNVEGSNLFIQTYTQTLEFSNTWEKFGAFFLMHFIAGCILLLAFSRAKRHKIILISAIIPVYAFARYSLLALMLISGGNVSIFWSPAVTALSFILLPAVLSFIIPVKETRRFQPAVHGRRFWLTTGLVFTAVFFISGLWGYHDAGTMKKGRVLLDENHSDWEWSTEKYDTEWYSEKSGYNYYCLFQYLGLYYRTDRNFNPITGETLKNYDVLVIKTPTRPFSKDEIDSITGFVRDGGGLFLLGDHTNVFGIATNLNPLSEKFGIRFNPNATYELTEGRLSEYEPPKVLPHPIVRDLPHFLFATSCTLDAPLNAGDVITGYGLKAVDADYSQKNFFPSDTTTAGMEFGLFLQDAAVEYGRGRVAAFTDSTVFSNFWMFMPGKPELALNTIDWLNRENRFPYLNYGFAFASAVLSLITLVSMRKAGTASSFYSAFLGIILAVPFSISVYSFVNTINYQEVKEIKDYTRISFERQYSDYEMPSSWQGFTAPLESQINTFYVWMQRLGYFPFTEKTVKNGLSKGDLTVVINPDKHLTENDRNYIRKSVLSGKKLLVMDNAGNDNSTANEFLEPFGLEIINNKLQDTDAFYSKSGTVGIGQNAGYVQGGTPMLSAKGGRPLCSTVRAGKGSVTAFSDSELFFNMAMGDVSLVPDDNQRKIGEFEFWMINRILNNAKEVDKE